MFDEPDAATVEPTTVNELDSIPASGAYRDLLDAALGDMAGSDLADTRPRDAEALQQRAATVYDVRSIVEAQALVEAATFVISDGPSAIDPHSDDADDSLTASQREAVVRIGEAAAEAAVALSPEAHGLRAADEGGTVDKGESVVSDGGVDLPERDHEHPERVAVELQTHDAVNSGEATIDFGVCGNTDTVNVRVDGEASAYVLAGVVDRLHEAGYGTEVLAYTNTQTVRVKATTEREVEGDA
jgi:hypothetical protein